MPPSPDLAALASYRAAGNGILAEEEVGARCLCVSRPNKGLGNTNNGPPPPARWAGSHHPIRRPRLGRPRGPGGSPASLPKRPRGGGRQKELTVALRRANAFSEAEAARIRNFFGMPYCIENVPGAPLIDPVTLCGSMFELKAPSGELRRHRLFEASFPLEAPSPCRHAGRTIGVYGAHIRDRRRPAGTNHKSGSNLPWRHAFVAMGVPIGSMTLTELSESIPPGLLTLRRRGVPGRAHPRACFEDGGFTPSGRINAPSRRRRAKRLRDALRAGRCPLSRTARQLEPR